jgi:alkylated DNA repair dioxygenase AlkB
LQKDVVQSSPMNRETGTNRLPERVQIDVEEDTAPVVEDPLTRDVMTLREHLLAQAELVESANTVCRNEQSGAAGVELGAPLDNLGVDVAQARRTRERQTGDTTADDQYAGHGDELMPIAGSPHDVSLFEPDTPDGFRYRADVLTTQQEAALVTEIGRVEFSTFEMRGVIAKRRVAFFGGEYDDAAESAPSTSLESRPLPAFLIPLRGTIAAWAGVEADAFAMALINEYPPGAPIGWHRDAPQYDLVAGVSLLSSCRMRFRQYLSPGARVPGAARRTATHEIVLAPRSAYVMDGDSRQRYEHSIPPVERLRYSITFRTLRASR